MENNSLMDFYENLKSKNLDPNEYFYLLLNGMKKDVSQRIIQ